MGPVGPPAPRRELADNSRGPGAQTSEPEDDALLVVQGKVAPIVLTGQPGAGPT